ncbi:MAG: hypothetical protein AUK03_04880 [Anaerolineae bacterium CG2_30_64_16]|nr:MAG: hypothetical protein AUK03_04880 [Anaerolineae bacterium CG2_30_64_16]
MRFRLLISVVLLTLAGLGACSSAAPTSTLGPKPTTPVRTATPQPASDEEAIRQLILLEGQGVVAQDITGLMGLWAEDAVVTDAKHTPDDTTDDARWQGRDAIRERYVVLVFPGNPSAAGATDLAITIEGNAATATSTTVIGGEVSPGGDRWTLAKRDGRWWITGLTYNLEPR